MSKFIGDVIWSLAAELGLWSVMHRLMETGDAYDDE